VNTREVRGLWLGQLGVAIFAMTLPMTRLAVGTPEAPQMSGAFIALGRAVVAAVLSAAFLAATRAPLPPRKDWPALAIASAGAPLDATTAAFALAVIATVFIGRRMPVHSTWNKEPA